MNLRAFAAYLAQRFPPVNMGLFAVLFLTVWSVATRGTPDAARSFGWREVGGGRATISFFFRLRVFDEIKDYALDALNHPQRVLQSGRVTLSQLRRLAWLGAAGELAWATGLGWAAVGGRLLAAGYGLLMRYEFFVSAYLKPRLVLYAFSHLLIMPLLIHWLWVCYRPEGPLPPRFWLLAALSLLGGFAFELARKIHAPAAERAGIDSYSRALGYRGALAAVQLVLLGGIAVQTTLLHQLQAGAWAFGLLAALFGFTLLVYLRAAARPQEKLLRAAELLVSLFMLTSYLALIASIRWQEI